MSFDNYYPNRKDRRKPYRKRGKCSRACRPHGGCEYCQGSRLHKHRKKELDIQEELEYNTDMLSGSDDAGES